MKSRIFSIETILERMAETEDKETFERVEQELKTEIRSYLTPVTHEIIEYYAKIWRVLREGFYDNQALINLHFKREAGVTIEELNYGRDN